MPETCSLPVVPGCLAWRQRGCVALLVGLILSLHLASGGQAATTWTVCASGCDYVSIKAAIAAPTTVDGDTLAIAAGTYTEPGITITKSLTLQGEAAATTIVQAAATPGTASDRVFTIPRDVIVTLQDLTVRYGKSSTKAGGGGIWNDGTLTLLKSTIRNNRAPYNTAPSCCIGGGGGIWNTGTLTLIQSTVRNNWAEYVGGGISNDWSGTLTLTASTISSNTTADVGGGLGSWGTLTLTHSTISGNTAKYNGGGLYNGGTLTLTHSTISGNTATTYAGGGLYSWGTMTLTHSTISGNTATTYVGGGLYIYGDGRLTLTTSIVANNQGGNCAGDRLPISHGYNLDSDGSCQLTAATDLPGTDPQLGPLQDHGGATLTHALLPGSPALDAIPWGANGCGTTLYSDQRWQARPQPARGACDIGAYEVTVAGQPLSAWVTGLTPHTAVCENVTTGQAVTLSDPVAPWDCEAAGLAVRSEDVVALRVRGPVKKSAADVGGAVVGLAPHGGGCTNRTTGQEVKFQALFQGLRGPTAASCVAAGLVIHSGDQVQMRMQGAAE